MAIHELPIGLTDNGQGLFEGIMLWAYNVTNGWFFVGALLSFCVVLMIATSRFGTPRSFGFASFVGALGASMLAIANLLSWPIASMFMIAGFVGIAVMVLNER